MAKFEINPLSLDPESARVVLNVEGQEISFDGGAPRPLVAQWPGPSGVRQSSVTFEPKTETKPTDVKPVDAKQPGVKPSEVKEPHPQPADTVTIARTGAWSVFRLLDAGHLETLGGPDRWRVTFAAGGHRAVFELHAGSIVNPLASHDLAEFRCPSL